MIDQNFITAAGDNSFIYIPAPNINRHLRVAGAEATLYPNFRPFPTTNSTQSELSIDVHPLDMNILLLWQTPLHGMEYNWYPLWNGYLPYNQWWNKLDRLG